MKSKVTSAEQAAALAEGRWMLRMDQNGVGRGGFRWPEPGEWIEADNWTDRATCTGGGFFGQGPGDGQHGYAHDGTRAVLAIYDGGVKCVDGNKIAVRRAAIVAVDADAWTLLMQLTGGAWPGSLYLRSYGHPLPPVLTSVGGSLHLGGYGHPLPPGLTSVGVYLYLSGYGHPLPPGLTSVGGSIYLFGYGHPLPPGLTSVGGSLDLRGYGHPLPPGLTSVGGDLDLRGYEHPLPPGLTSVGGYLDLRGYGHPLPPGLRRGANS